MRTLAGSYGFFINEKLFHLSEWLPLRPFDTTVFAHNELLQMIRKMHKLLNNLDLPSSFRKYDGWLGLPLKRLPQTHGENLPFMEQYAFFLKERFPKISFKKGNIHTDIHYENVCLDNQNQLVLLDWDSSQQGMLAMDYVRATAMYLDFSGGQVKIDNHYIEELKLFLSRLCLQITQKDIRYLLIRSLLVGECFPEGMARDIVENRLKALAEFTR